jgi:hypothetical protein
MAWLEDDSEDEQNEGKGPTRMTAFYICIALLPLLFLFEHLGKYDLGMNVCFCLSVNAIVILTRWELKKYVWFWGVMALIVALELPIAFTVKWPEHQWVPAVSLLPIWLAGYLVAMGAIKLVEHFMVKDSPSDDDA